MKQEQQDAIECLMPFVKQYLDIRREERIAKTAQELGLHAIMCGKAGPTLTQKQAHSMRKVAEILNGQPADADKQEKE